MSMPNWEEEKRNQLLIFNLIVFRSPVKHELLCTHALTRLDIVQMCKCAFWQIALFVNLGSTA
jgi:hypothetical protein